MRSPNWSDYLHNLRRKELETIFSHCPQKIFNEGLELGAGDGFQSTILTKFVSILICTDINPNRLRRKDIKSIKYRICDAEEIKTQFNKKQFDFIFSSNLLEHIPDINKVLNAIHHLLKDDGITIHIIPNPLWKMITFLLHVPNRVLTIYKSKTKSNNTKASINTTKNFNINNKDDSREKSKLLKSSNNQIEINENKKTLSNNIKIIGNNPKIKRREKSFIYRLLIPVPHGVSSNNIKEIMAFSKYRWKEEFKKANLELIKIKKGPVASGYGFGFNHLRSILEKARFSTENIFITIKKGKNSPYKKYF